jgi:hypothetical protein
MYYGEKPPSHYGGSLTLKHFGDAKLIWFIDISITPIIGSGSMQVVMTNGKVAGGRSMVVAMVERYVVCSGGHGDDVGSILGEVVLSVTISYITW